ncbi:glycyl radical protein [Candidatus Bathyarchaeota archaeon]|nr:glycyl radical protein [Candidatus Bathyarchaeota archaeon]
MNERVQRLREESVNIKPFITYERAKLLTDFYKNSENQKFSVPVFRALALRHLLLNKKISIGKDELIVGERGPSPKATPTFPELCCHTLEDLDIMSSRKRTPFRVSEETRQVYEKEIIPFWKGKTIREKIFNSMDNDWLESFDAGIFTEFMEQRAPGHAVLGDKIYHKGLNFFKKEIRESIDSLDFINDPRAYAKEEELKAMEIVADTISDYAKRYSELALNLANLEKDDKRKSELLKISEICSYVPSNPPQTFWEALQCYWFCHLAVVTELNTWDSYCPGRLDQHLISFYTNELEDGSLDKETAKELLECFWVKFNNQPAPPKVAITEEQSGTYQDFALINVGGLKSDGSDAVNELSYLILDVVKEMHLIQPSACIQLSKKNPDIFLKHATKVVQAGFGQPSMFNTDVILLEFLRQGKSIFDARSGGPSGCVEISVFGKENCNLTGYINWPKILEITLNNGVDPASGKKIGLETGNPRNFTDFKQLLEAYRQQLNYFIEIKIKGNNIIERIFAELMPTPVMSLFVEDCIKSGLDYHQGGARYNSTYIQGVGIASTTDSLSAIKYHVFDQKNLSFEELLQQLNTNFEDERIRQLLLKKTPKYGNDLDYADNIAKTIFNYYFEALDGRPNTKGGQYRANLLPTTVHIYFGRVTGALPDGRRSGEPLNDGISPSHGSDKKGPTSVIKSASKIDHALTGGTLLNQKFIPSVLSDDLSLDKLASLVRTYFRLDGHHIQFNVIDSKTLREAQKNPEKYLDLIVRVAGYSDYFVDIGKELQEEIIARTEQKIF